MGDMCDTQDILFSLEGMDYEMLYEKERAAKDTRNYSHTDHDKKGLRLFGCVSTLEKRQCTFF